MNVTTIDEIVSAASELRRLAEKASYVQINDTFGNFGMAHEGSRWQAIDTPCGDVAP